MSIGQVIIFRRFAETVHKNFGSSSGGAILRELFLIGGTPYPQVKNFGEKFFQIRKMFWAVFRICI